MRNFAALCVTTAMIAAPAFANSLSEKASLQAAMQSHVEGQLIDGAYLNLDLENGEVAELYPTETHPMIMEMGDNYVLCITLSDKSGKKYLVDHYLAKRGDEFVMLRSEIDNRTPLQKLMKAGLARRMK